MSPEVILAMDEGQYDTKVDVWSLGITCIELAERKPPLYNMNAMSALYHIAQNDSPSLTTQVNCINSSSQQEQRQLDQQNSDKCEEWSDSFKSFVDSCLRKLPQNRPSAFDLLGHKFIVELSDRSALINLIRKTKEIVRDLDNLQYRKMKKIIMVDSSSSNSVISASGDSTSCLNTSLIKTGVNSMTNNDRDGMGSESGASSLLNLKNDGSETSHTSHLGDASSQLDDYENYEIDIDDHETSSVLDNFNEQLNSAIDSDIQKMIKATQGLNICSKNNTAEGASKHEKTATLNSFKSECSASIQTPCSFTSSNLSDNNESSFPCSNKVSSQQKLNSSHQQQAQLIHSGRTSSISNQEIINFADSLKRRSAAAPEEVLQPPHPIGFATIKTTQAIVSEEQSQREHQDVIEFQNLKRQHAKLLKVLETKLRAELDELKCKSEKEYSQEVIQFTKDLDSTRLKHLKELDELKRYKLNEEKKFLNNNKEANSKELKRYIHELENEYKKSKEELKKEISVKALPFKEREERLKLGKERLHNEARIKEDKKRKQLDVNSTEELCLLQRKHLIMSHKREYELLSNEINEQKLGLSKNHGLLKNHLNSTYQIKQRHCVILQRRKQEFMEKEISEELTNYKNYCERRRRDLKKKHAYESKQHPKHLKVSFFPHRRVNIENLG